MRPEIADHGPATWTDQRPQDTAHRGGGRVRGQIEGLRAIIDSHPNPLECEKHNDDDTVSCGWKLAYTQIVQQIGGGEAA